MIHVELSDRELGAVLAGLRYLQENSARCHSQRIVSLLTDGGRRCALDDNEIDALIDRINSAPVRQAHKPIGLPVGAVGFSSFFGKRR